MLYAAAAAAVALLAAAALLLAAAAASYGRALQAEVDAWWMRGAAGRATTTALLDLLFAVGAGAGPAGRRLDASMAAAAAVRAAALVAAPPRPGAVLFVGSSTFTYWCGLAEDMRRAGVAGPPCVNAAFGGSTTGHLLAARVDALCGRLAPAVVVYFCGSNDVNLRREGAAANFAAFAARLHAAAPRARLVYLAPTVTPFMAARRGGAYAARLREEAARARAVCASTPGCEFVGSAPFQADAASYLGDGHHLTPAGHAQLAVHLAPAVLRALACADAAYSAADAAAADAAGGDQAARSAVRARTACALR